ncbi:CGNR zinc finger domain-containing protein [Streptomyces sp. SID9727]|uniref:CGNR zinc finger domain-containing protein n=1 Tax=Streptomyces sp. SID9727 TaxID=2706114 RepID=UPI0013C82929|nr:CGNR zinc finger domain-containing protein [Streptomyces sp. SID9727]NEC68865.1 CGNR zinc finger domain-containing protein [Streptomyces sp. SID9727]
MPVTFTELPLVALTELVNAWGTLPREAAGRGNAPTRPEHLATHLGLPTDVEAELTPEECTRAADLLHQIFSAQNTQTCAQRLAHLLVDVGARPALEATANDSLSAVWRVDDPGQVLLAASALALRQYVTTHGIERIGTCTGDHCADVYIDRSPGGRRRFCSITCQNRTRVATFRRRKAAGTD